MLCVCSTPSSESEQARIKQGGAALSTLEDEAETLLTYMDRLGGLIEETLDSKHNQTDDKIEAEVGYECGERAPNGPVSWGGVAYPLTASLDSYPTY